MPMYIGSKIGFALAVGVVVLLVLLNAFGAAERVRTPLAHFTSSVQGVLWQSGTQVASAVKAVGGSNSNRHELDQCEQRTARLQSEVAVMQNLQKENKALRRALDLELHNTPLRFTEAQVTGMASGRVLLIGKGERDDIRAGQPVITANRVLAGRIHTVHDRFSEVALISHTDIEFPGRILNTELSGVVKGTGSVVQLTEIQKETEIEKEYPVVTSAVASDYPTGLLVGTIETIRDNEVAPYRTATVDPAFSAADHAYLFVVTEF